MKSPQLLAMGSASINMTPMIDVVFLLIIFFLVSSHLAQRENSIKLDLPEAVSGLDEQSQQAFVVVNILPDGDWQFSGSSVDESQLVSALKRRSLESGEPLRLKIRTDQSVAYRRIEPVLRAATTAGIGDIVFSVYEERPR